MHRSYLSLFTALLLIFLQACGSTTTTPQTTTQEPNNPRQGNDTNTTENNTSTETNTTIPPDENETVIIPTNNKIFLIGDSTATIENAGKVGWGLKMEDTMLHPENFYNLAIGGVSSRSYKQTDTKDWTKTKQLILETNTSTGAYLLIQLGINDIALTQADAMDERTKTTMPGRGNSYYLELKEYVDWSKDHNITPVLLTPLAAMVKYNANVDMEHYFLRTYGDYAQTIRELAEDTDILLIDVEDKTWREFNAYTPAALLARFSGGEDEEGRADRIHLSDEGATIVAGWVKELICNSRDETFCKQFKNP